MKLYVDKLSFTKDNVDINKVKSQIYKWCQDSLAIEIPNRQE